MKARADVDAIVLLQAIAMHGCLAAGAWDIIVSAAHYLGARAFDGVSSHGSKTHVSSVARYLDRLERAA